MSRVSRRARNLALAGVAALAGFVSLGIVFGALFLGLWLDAQLGQRGPLTITLLVLSVPVSLLVMLRIVLGAVGRIVPQPPKAQRSPRSTRYPSEGGHP